MIQFAAEMFARLNCLKDVAVYNALVARCNENRQHKETFTMPRKMTPNGITLFSALSACLVLLKLCYGKQTRCLMIRHGFVSDVILRNACVSHGHGDEALKWWRMEEGIFCNVTPNTVTLLAVL